MNGFEITIFTLQNRRHTKNNENLCDWVIESAKKFGIDGATLIRASRGLGRDGKWHDAMFFELSEQPMEIKIIANANSCDALLKYLASEKQSIFYTKTPLEFGTI